MSLAIHDNEGEFVLQVKKNCQALYEEVMELFNGLSEEQENDKKDFWINMAIITARLRPRKRTGRDMNTGNVSHTAIRTG